MLILTALLLFTCPLVAPVQAMRVSVNYRLICPSVPYQFTVELLEDEDFHENLLAHENKVSQKVVYDGKIVGVEYCDEPCEYSAFYLRVTHNCRGKRNHVTEVLPACDSNIRCDYNETVVFNL